MEFRILGPLEVRDGRKLVPLGAAKPRALLGVLLLSANETVSSDRLVDELWGEKAPRSANKLVQGYVSQLRRLLGGAIETRAPGYRIRVDPDDLDLIAFLRLADEARAAARGADLRRAAQLFSDALSLWRDRPLCDVELHGPAAVESGRLAEVHLGLALDRFDVELALGRHGELVSELEALVLAHPLHERLRGQLMLALYRSGRQADALRVYRELRSLLVEQLGLEPSDALRRLETGVLRHDPELAAPSPEALHAAAPSTPDAAFGDTPRPREERRLASVLLIDLTLDGLAPGADPESARATRASALAAVEQQVLRHGGVVEHVVGDRVLAVFGVTQAHEDDSDRAVRSAASALASLEEMRRNGSPAAVARAAVETGDVLVSDDGTGRRTLTGAPVAAVERLLAAAGPGKLVVGNAARAATADTIEYSELAEDVPLRAWELSAVAAPEPAARRRLSLDARLVGRGPELALLRHELELLRTDARPRLVTVLGAAGVGKSRLAHELLVHVDTSKAPLTVLRGRCLAYGNLSYSALADAVKAECGILADDPVEIVSDKVVRAVGRLFGDDAPARQVEALVGGRPAEGVTREDLFDTWRRLLERVARRAPLLLVLEDLHWADDGLLDFVDHAVGWAEAPLLVLALARPELLDRRSAWGGGKRNATSITLEPLTPAETETLAGELLGGEPPREVVRLLVERSEGNPLFGEEILRMLIDRGVLRPIAPGEWAVDWHPSAAELPPSVRAVIAARLDALPRGELDVLRAAAVVGRVFWVGAVQRLCGLSRRDTRELLGRLRGRDVLVTHEDSSFSGEPELAFRHVLIRDAAYESLPKHRRIRAHVELAGWVVEHAGGREEDVAEILATHHLRALDYLEQLGEADEGNSVRRAAYRWTRTAGERAHRLWQQRESGRWLREALNAATGLEVAPEELARLSEAYAHACEGVEPYTEVAAAYEAALAAYTALGDATGAGRMEAWRAFVAFQTGDDDAVLSWSQRALEHLEPRGDSRELALALIILGWTHRRSGRFDEAEPRLRRAVVIASSVGDPVIRAQASVSLGKCLQQSGNVEEGVPLLEQALELAREAGDLPVLLRTLIDLSEAHEEATGDYSRAEALIREGLELARRAGHRQQVAWMESNLADYLVDLGRLDEAEPLTRSGLDEARHVGEPRRVALTLPTVAYVALLRADVDEAQRSLDELRGLTDQVREVYAACWVPLLEGLIAQARRQRDRAADLLLEGARRQAGRTEIWGAVNLLAEAVRCAVGVGRLAEAREPRSQLAALAAWSVPARAFLAWADGLLEEEPGTAATRLGDAAAAFEGLGRRVELGRCLVDVGVAEERSGGDPTRALTRAQDVLRSAGATLFLKEVPAVAGVRRGTG